MKGIAPGPWKKHDLTAERGSLQPKVDQIGDSAGGAAYPRHQLHRGEAAGSSSRPPLRLASSGQAHGSPRDAPADRLADSAAAPGRAGRRPRRHKSRFDAVRRLVDRTLIVSSSAFTVGFVGGDWLAASLAAIIVTAVFGCFAEVKRLYRSWRIDGAQHELACVLEIWLGVAGLSLAALYLLHDSIGAARDATLYWLLLMPVPLCGWRLGGSYVLRKARSKGMNTRRLAIVGSGSFPEHLARTIQACSWTGFRVVGIFSDPPDGEDRGGAGKLGERSLDTLVRLARGGNVDVIYITVPANDSGAAIEELLQRLSNSTISAYLVHDRRSRGGEIGEAQTSGLGWFLGLPWLHRCMVDIGGIEAVSVYESPFLGPSGWVKRAEDLAISSVALLVLAVPMALIALGVKVTSSGPVFFKQRRYGLDGRGIIVWKFRSMTVCEDGDHIAQAKRQDPRVTRFGSFLRRTSLDELPQFINVLQGTMSIVGPRPHAVAHNEYYRELVGGYMLRHKVKPGITGWAQVNGLRGETENPEKMRQRVEFDLSYIRNWSLWLDIRIVLMTILCGLVNKNAY